MNGKWDMDLSNHLLYFLISSGHLTPTSCTLHMGLGSGYKIYTAAILFYFICNPAHPCIA